MQMEAVAAATDQCDGDDGSATAQQTKQGGMQMEEAGASAAAADADAAAAAAADAADDDDDDDVPPSADVSPSPGLNNAAYAAVADNSTAIPLKVVHPEQVYNLSLFSYFVIFDSRPHAEFAKSHIVGSFSLPFAHHGSSSSDVADLEQAREQAFQSVFARVVRDGLEPDNVSPIIICGNEQDAPGLAKWLHAKFMQARQASMRLAKVPNVGDVHVEDAAHGSKRFNAGGDGRGNNDSGDGVGDDADGSADPCPRPWAAQRFVNRVCNFCKEVWVMGHGGFASFYQDFPFVCFPQLPSFGALKPFPQRITPNLFLGNRAFRIGAADLAAMNITHVIMPTAVDSHDTVGGADGDDDDNDVDVDADADVDAGFNVIDHDDNVDNNNNNDDNHGSDCAARANANVATGENNNNNYNYNNNNTANRKTHKRRFGPRNIPGVNYLFCDVPDSNDGDKSACWDACIRFIDEAMAASGGACRILIHLYGRSRSAAVAVAYLISKGYTYDRAMGVVLACSNKIDRKLMNSFQLRIRSEALDD